MCNATKSLYQFGQAREPKQTNGHGRGRVLTLNLTSCTDQIKSIGVHFGEASLK
jgi:hypothetical protein